MSTIPASYAVNVQPNVLPAGGSALDLNGLLLTTSTRPPIGSVLSFAGPLAVEDFFGGNTPEVAAAEVYFAGFDGSNVKPGALLFAQYPVGQVSAYLRGGDASGLSLADLQAINGSLSVAIDGVTQAASIDLSSATSFSNAAQAIETALDIEGAQQAEFTATIAATVMTVSAMTSGAIAVGQSIEGAGVGVGTYVASFGTGTGGAGTYNLSTSSTVGSPEDMTAFAPAVQFDSVSGAFVISSATVGVASTIAFATGATAAPLMLTAATGAVLSQGAAAATPDSFMNSVIAKQQNFASFATLFDPDAEGEIDVRMAFALWNSQQNNRYVYVPTDSAVAPRQTVPATSSLGYALQQAGYGGTFLEWTTSVANNDAALVCGFIASIDFNETNGRITFAFKHQDGFPTSVEDLQSAINLGGNPLIVGDRGNGYNFYGAFATANQNFQNLQRGTVSGAFLWLDSYVNQISLNNQFQLDLWTLLTTVRSIPYNAAGNAMIEAALADTIQKYLKFGAYRAGVQLSSVQVAAVNAQAPAGQDIASTLQNQGWYLLIGTATPEVRQARGTPPMKFFYVDGEAVQAISLSSIALQ